MGSFFLETGPPSYERFMVGKDGMRIKMVVNSKSGLSRLHLLCDPATLVKALLIAVGFWMIPAYRTPAQKMEMERLRAEGAVPAELQALMQLEERMKDLRRDV